MQKDRAVLFDVDGTLIDSAPGIIHTLEKTFAEMNTDVSGKNLMQYVGPPLRRTFAEYYSDEADIERATEIYRCHYAAAGSHECVLYPGAAEMLNALRAAGMVLCTATSKPTRVVEPILRELGIAGFFDVIGGASLDKSRDTKTEVIRYVLGLPQLSGRRVLMVGDRRDDLQGAADCDIPAAAVLYGYGGREELAPFVPCFFAKDCMALTDFICNKW